MHKKFYRTPIIINTCEIVRLRGVSPKTQLQAYHIKRTIS